MKIRRLLEVDLARLAPLPPDEQRTRMSKLLGGGARFSFHPMRAQLLDIMNVQPFAPETEEFSDAFPERTICARPIQFEHLSITKNTGPQRYAGAGMG